MDSEQLPPDSSQPEPAAAGEGPQSLPARVLGIFFSPGEVFRRLGPKPKWFMPVLLVIVVQGVCSSTWVPMVVEQQEAEFKKRGEEMPDEQRAFMESAAMPIVMGVSTALGVLVMTLVSAGVVYLVFQLLGSGAGTFRQVLSVVSHAGLVNLIGAPLNTAMIHAKGSMYAQLTLRSLLPFLEEESFLAKFLMWGNVFSLWSLGIMAVGIAIVYRRPAGSTAAVIFGVYFAIAALSAAIF